MISQKEQWQNTAKEALDKFYAERAEKLEKNKTLNRENADALRVEQDNFDPTDGKNDQQKWEMVTQRIDFNAKGNQYIYMLQGCTVHRVRITHQFLGKFCLILT